MKPETVAPRFCEDCGDEIPANERRRRCQYCGEMICGWCFNHVHAIMAHYKLDNATQEECDEINGVA
jgi:hypothetical protein